jgi:hypothetical protein
MKRSSGTSTLEVIVHRRPPEILSVEGENLNRGEVIVDFVIQAAVSAETVDRVVDYSSGVVHFAGATFQVYRPQHVYVVLERDLQSKYFIIIPSRHVPFGARTSF